MIISKSPEQCSTDELRKFIELVLEGGEVTPHGLEARIRKAEKLIFSIESDCLIGVAAVKKPDQPYKQTLFQKARASTNFEQYLFELGWIFVLPSARGAGVSHTLVEAALAASGNKGIFATTRVDNIPMKKVLISHGFLPHGETYPSKSGGNRIALLLRHPPSIG